MRTEKRKIGDLGEALARRFLVKNGFSVLQRNFLRPCGEIDIVAAKEGTIYFVEVKTVTYRTFSANKGWGSHNPEENVGSLKLGRMRRVVAVYLREKRVKKDFKFMVISVSVENLPNGNIRPRYSVLYDVL